MKIFVDTSIILAFLAGEDPRARDVIEAVENGTFIGYANPVVIDEVIHGYLRLATGLSSRRIRQLLARRDERLLKLLRNDVQPVLELFIVLPLAISVNEVLEIIETYGLMPSDALIVASCRHYGIDTIATFDEDFKRVPWLRVVP